MATLKDVAEMAGVSVATVSHVVNNTRKISPETRDRVERAIAQLGFVPNAAGRMLALKRLGPRTTKPRRKALTGSEDTPGGQQGVNKIPSNSSEPPSAEPVDQIPDAVSQAKTVHMLLRYVRANQPVSRVALAQGLAVSRGTLSETLKPLLAAGVLREGRADQPASDVPAGSIAGLTVNGDSSYFAGVHLGVRRSQIGLSTLAGEILAEDDFETPDDPEAALAMARASLERLRSGMSGRELKMIGVSIPGPTNAERDHLVYAPHLGWRNVAIAKGLRLRAESGGTDHVPVIVENDATAAAMYEARLRLRNVEGGAWDDFVLVRSGTGIGVGLVLGGEVYRGTGQAEGFAGEFGHTIIVAGGKQCVCGNRGCWERYGSASAASTLYMGDRVQLGGMKAPKYVEIVERAEAGEIRAQRTLERVGEYLGIGIGNVITGLGVPRVIISGRVLVGWRFLKDSINEAVGQSMAGKMTGWSVEPGEQRGAGLGGALEVAVEEYLSGTVRW
jgi:predicted NBD/HSP70 family sugar kinase